MGTACLKNILLEFDKGLHLQLYGHDRLDAGAWPTCVAERVGTGTPPTPTLSPRSNRRGEPPADTPAPATCSAAAAPAAPDEVQPPPGQARARRVSFAPASCGNGRARAGAPRPEPGALHSRRGAGRTPMYAPAAAAAAAAAACCEREHDSACFPFTASTRPHSSSIGGNPAAAARAARPPPASTPHTSNSALPQYLSLPPSAAAAATAAAAAPFLSRPSWRAEVLSAFCTAALCMVLLVAGMAWVLGGLLSDPWAGGLQALAQAQLHGQGHCVCDP